MARRDRPQKTNAMRELEAAGISFEARSYPVEGDEALGAGYGVHVAELLGEDPDSAFKTLVCVTPTGGHVVCCIPVAAELDLRKAATAVGEKSLSLVHVRDLEPTTGYVRGGCSPVGMRRHLPTVIDETAQLFDRIGVSGGRRGLSLLVSPEALAGFCGASFADIVREGF